MDIFLSAASVVLFVASIAINVNTRKTANTDVAKMIDSYNKMKGEYEKACDSITKLVIDVTNVHDEYNKLIEMAEEIIAKKKTTRKKKEDSNVQV